MTVDVRGLAPPLEAAAPPSERELRVDLAACYRLIALHGMDDTIYTHATARLPGPAEHFLINPYGLAFDEITASSLVKIGLDGEKLEPSPWPVNPPGFVIHSAVHSGRPDAGCVVHTHTTAGMAVAATEKGLLPISQFALEFWNRLATHDYEGIADPDDAIAQLERLEKQSGGFGCFLQMAHNWADFAETKRSYELFARYVMPRFQHLNVNRDASMNWAAQNRPTFIGAMGNAINQEIQKHVAEQRAKQS